MARKKSFRSGMNVIVNLPKAMEEYPFTKKYKRFPAIIGEGRLKDDVLVVTRKPSSKKPIVLVVPKKSIMFR